MVFRLALVVTFVVVFVSESFGTSFDGETGDLAEMIAHLTAEDLSQSNDEPSVKRSTRDTDLLELKNDGMKWRIELLSGVNKLQVNYPGEVFVFGSQAEPIFAAPGQTIIAAAEYGKGRVVVATKTELVSGLLGTTSDPDMKQFFSNVKNWVTKGQYQSDEDFLVLDSQASGPFAFGVEAKKGLIYAADWDVKASAKDVLDFVREGGGLVYGITTWWWQYMHEGKTVAEMPLAEVLHTTGFCFNTWYISQSEFAISDNRAADTHVVRALISAANGNFNASLIDPVYALNRISPHVDRNLMKSNLQPVFDKLNSIVTSADFPFPSPEAPLTDTSVRKTFDLWHSVYPICAEEGLKAPGCNAFPGDFPQPPVTVTSDIITITSTSLKSGVYATGYYLPAGRWLTVELLPSNADECVGWSVEIGNYNDDLSNKDSLYRWPIVDKTVSLNKPLTKVISAFGGTVRFWSQEGKISTCRARLQNVVPTPFFKLGDDIEKWNNEVRNYPGLWADLSGKYFQITLPSSSIRNVDPTAALKFWDKVVSSYHDLRGTDVDKERPQWFISDVQLSGGWMHAGYPINSYMSYADPSYSLFILGPGIIAEGGWGVFHEIGHNMQQSAWTFDGMGEVTVNIFSLYAFDTLYGVKPFTNPWLYDGLNGVKDSLLGNKSWPIGDVGVDLYIYAQIARDFGWDCYKKFFRRYQAMSDSELPTTNQDKTDLVFFTFSQESGYNLTPLTKFWNIPISDTALAKMALLPISFFPDDELTRSAIDRTTKVLAEFPNAKRSLP